MLLLDLWILTFGRNFEVLFGRQIIIRVNSSEGFSGCVACWRSIIARPIVANILL